MRPRARRTSSAVVAGLALFLVAACAATAAGDKTGERVVVLKFAAIDELNPNGQTVAPTVFVRRIEELSHGKIKVSIEHRGNGAPDAESNLVAAMDDGAVDGGWPSTRAFANAGISGLETTEAPFVLTTLAAEKAVVSGPTGKALLDTLDKTGIVGLGLTVGPLRRPFAKRVLLGPADWAGITFRAYNSPIQEAALRALGAVPVSASYNFPDLIGTGKLLGAETDVAQYEFNHYNALLPKVTRNVVLWPKMQVLALSRRAFDRLTHQEQGWVRTAAADAVRAGMAYRYDEVTPAKAMCMTGVRFFDASEEDVAALHQAVEPVLTRFAQDPINGPLLADLQKVAAAHPGVDVPSVPRTCMAD